MLLHVDQSLYDLEQALMIRSIPIVSSQLGCSHQLGLELPYSSHMS